MGKRKRTYTLYFDEAIGKTVIDKPKEDMNSFELKLIKEFPGLYTNRVSVDDDSKSDDWEKVLEKRQRQLEKQQEKDEELFWKKVIKQQKKSR